MFRTTLRLNELEKKLEEKMELIGLTKEELFKESSFSLEANIREKYNFNIEKIEKYYYDNNAMESIDKLKRVVELCEIETIFENYKINHFSLLENTSLGIYYMISNISKIDKKPIDVNDPRMEKLLDFLSENGYSSQVELIKIRKVFDEKEANKELRRVQKQLRLEISILKKEVEETISETIDNFKREFKKEWYKQKNEDR